MIQITYKDLSPWLKASIVFGWVSMVWYSIVLLAGLMVLIFNL